MLRCTNGLAMYFFICICVSRCLILQFNIITISIKFSACRVRPSKFILKFFSDFTVISIRSSSVLRLPIWCISVAPFGTTGNIIINDSHSIFSTSVTLTMYFFFASTSSSSCFSNVPALVYTTRVFIFLISFVIRSCVCILYQPLIIIKLQTKIKC